MRGLGIGILLTTILLSISFSSSSKNKLSDEEIIKRAEELGMISSEEGNQNEILTSKAPDKKDTMETIEETVDEIIEQTSDLAENLTKEDTTDQEDTIDHEETTNQEDTIDHEDTTNQEEKTNQEETTNHVQTTNQTVELAEKASTDDASKQQDQVDEITPQDSTVAVEIKKGMNSEDVASMLKHYGVIDDNKHFNQYLIDNGYAKIILDGVFELPIDANYEQITDIIIK